MLRAVRGDSTEYGQLRNLKCALCSFSMKEQKSSPHGSPDPAAAHLRESTCPLRVHSTQTLQRLAPHFSPNKSRSPHHGFKAQSDLTVPYHFLILLSTLSLSSALDTWVTLLGTKLTQGLCFSCLLCPKSSVQYSGGVPSPELAHLLLQTDLCSPFMLKPCLPPVEWTTLEP